MLAVMYWKTKIMVPIVNLNVPNKSTKSIIGVRQKAVRVTVFL